jgi:signal transduction histidine kinase
MRSSLPLAKQTKIWVSVLSGLMVAQILASLLMSRGPVLTNTSDIIQGLLLLVATAAFLLNTSQSTSTNLQTRLFWILMTTGMIFWLAYQGMWSYFEVFKRQDVPNPFLGDVVLFLHLVPMIAALAVLPHMREDERDERIRMLDFSLLLTWWVFIYVYAVIPWQTVQVDEAAYTTNFNFAYLTEKLVLLGALAAVAYMAQGGWRQLFGQLLGASALYASSSYVANWAIGRKIYYSGSLYDIPLTVSIAWMAITPLIGARVNLSDARASRPMLGIWITRLSMLALFSLLWAAITPELKSTLPPAVSTFRITVSLLTMVVMGVLVFWRQRLLRRALSHLLEQSRQSVTDLKLLQNKLIQSEKLASLGQLVGGAAHEINNPLTAMLGYSDLLSVSSLPPEDQLQATQINEQVRRTTTLVASLLTFARQAPAKLGPVDINSVIQTTVRLLAPQLEGDGKSIQPGLSSSLPLVMADSNQILHVCIHLAGQVKGRLNRETNSTLFVSSRFEQDLVFVDFSSYDISAGVCKNAVPPQPITSEGTNKPLTLSLSACCRIVEEHGGRLLYVAEGTTVLFRMELRVASAGRPSFLANNRVAARGAV